MTDHIADVSKMVADNPGVQGLAQLGRNAIERVSELERELAAAVAERDAARRSAQCSADAVACIETQDRNVLREIARMLIEQIGASGPEFAMDTARRACGVIESMATRLAVIDALPTGSGGGGDAGNVRARVLRILRRRAIVDRDHESLGKDMIAAVQQVLGPQLGLVTREEMARRVEAAYRECGNELCHYDSALVDQWWTESNARKALGGES